MRAVNSIPAYVERCSHFFTIAPFVSHHELPSLNCDYGSWLGRGWWCVKSHSCRACCSLNCVRTHTPRCPVATATRQPCRAVRSLTCPSLAYSGYHRKGRRGATFCIWGGVTFCNDLHVDTGRTLHDQPERSYAARARPGELHVLLA